MTEVVIYEWPTSQLCLECIHGSWANIDMGEEHVLDVALCYAACKDNDGTHCPQFEQDKNKVKEEEK